MKAPVIHLILAAACSLPAVGQQPAAGQQPAVPDNIDLPKDARLVLQAKGDGVQIYTCSETSSGTKTPDKIEWSPAKPDARLLDTSGRPIGTHFAGPTWKLNDGGQVQGELTGRKKSPDGSIPWLRLRAKEGTATGSLASVAYIRRTDTEGGVAPESGCKSQKDVKKTIPIHYTATYTFYAEK